MTDYRIEKDLLGEVQIEAEELFGIHTHRALNNFRFSDDTINLGLFQALVMVKQAAAAANYRAGLLSREVAEAIDQAAEIVLADPKRYRPPLHPLQGGAGTSTNMAVNELLCNLALIKAGRRPGDYSLISPLDHVNLSQSTNDTYPTAVRIAIIKGLKILTLNIQTLLAALQNREREFGSILKIGRTELQDAMPISLGQEFSAWAEALSRFRWRLSKARDWIREINITGTAVGTGINADSHYSAEVINVLREITEEPLALSRNLIDGTQNLDQIVEISGLLKTGAVSLKKMSADLRLLSSGPDCGFGELFLPRLQAGSSIMPGKVNPVLLEAAEQICLTVIGGDQTISVAAAESNLELGQFLPLIASIILNNIELMSSLAERLAPHIEGITPNLPRIRRYLETSSGIATLLAPILGHDQVDDLLKQAKNTDTPVIELIRSRNLISEAMLNRLISPEVMASPGLPVLSKDEES